MLRSSSFFSLHALLVLRVFDASRTLLLRHHAPIDAARTTPTPDQKHTVRDGQLSGRPHTTPAIRLSGTRLGKSRRVCSTRHFTALHRFPEG